jgi:hypothetical protein
MIERVGLGCRLGCVGLHRGKGKGERSWAAAQKQREGEGFSLLSFQNLFSNLYSKTFAVFKTI